MRQVIFRSCILLFAAAGLAACSSGDDPSNPGGTGAGSTGPSTGPGGGPTGSSCKVVGDTVQISDSPGSTPSLAWDGTRFGVTWVSTAGDEIRAAVLDADGQPVGQTSIAQGTELQQPRIYAENGGFLVLWSEGSSVMGRRIGTNGGASGAAFDIASGGAAEPHARGVMGPSGFLAAWDGQNSGELGLVSGSALVKSVPLQGTPTFPAPASNGKSSGVFWSEGDAIHFAAVDGALGLGQAATIPGQATNKESVAFGGSYYVTWEDLRHGEGSEDIFVAKVGGSGAASKGVQVPSNGGSANWPAIAAAGDFIAVTYYQFRDGPPSIFLALFTPDLTRVGEDLMVSPDNEADRFPSIVWANDRFGVAYAEKQGPVKLRLAECH